MGVTNTANHLGCSKEVNLAPFSLLEALHLSQIQKGGSLSRNSSEASDEHMWEQVPDKEKHSLLSDYKNQYPVF